MAIGGYRVCAIATKETTATDLSKVSRLQRRLTFEGFIAFREILLPDAAKNIKHCEQAGIKVIMFTDGENESDRFTARSLGVIKNDEEIINLIKDKKVIILLNKQDLPAVLTPGDLPFSRVLQSENKSDRSASR